MKGLKGKILIVFLLAVALIIGYQAYVMANGETYLKPAGKDVPVKDGNNSGMMLYCREHGNGWRFGRGYYNAAVSYICTGETIVGTTADGTNHGGSGVAFLLNFYSGDTSQRWFWSRSGSSEGAPILNPGTNFRYFFGGFDGQEIDQEYKDYIEEIQKTSVKLNEALNDPTLCIVDEVPYMFFDEKLDSEDDANYIVIDSDNKIGITYEEYNYVYQLESMLNYINSLTANTANIAQEMEKHKAAYESDGVGTVINELIKDRSSDKIKEEFSSVDETNELNKYGESITKWTGTLKDGRNVILWAFNDDAHKTSDGKYNVVYYTEQGNKSGTLKFDDTVLEGKETISNWYYNNGASKTEIINFFKNKGFDGLAKAVESRAEKDRLTLKEVENLLAGIYGTTGNKIEEKSKSNEEVDIEIKIEIPVDDGSLKYEKNLSALEASKAYQYFVDSGILAKWSQAFEVNSSNAKVSIDAENGKYIVGPFSMRYATIKLGKTSVLEVTNFNVLLKNGDSTITLSASENPKNNEYRLIKNSNSSIPESGETFYIELDKEVKGAGTLLDKNDNVTFNVTYHKLKYAYATIHFLNAVDGDKSDTGAYGAMDKFSRSHPQRLMAVDAKCEYEDNTIDAAAKTDYHDFYIYKEDENGKRLQGAKFAAIAKYTCGGKTLFVDLETQRTSFDIANVPVKYETDANGILQFKNIINNITFNNEVYTLAGLVVKEMQAPEGYQIGSNGEVKIKEGTANIDGQIITMPVTGKTTELTIINDELNEYNIQVRKVDENGEPIKGIEFSYHYLNLSTPVQAGSITSYTSIFNEGTATTDDNGYATFKNDMYNDVIALVVSEGENSNYDYFKRFVVIYKATVDDNGNKVLNFLDFEDTKDMEGYCGDIKPGSREYYNGVFLFSDKDWNTKYGTDAEEYITTGTAAGNGVDIQIKNDTVKPTPYSIVLNKYDEKGNSNDLDGTEFKVILVNNNENNDKHEGTVTVKDGKATIEDITIYGENLSLYLEETPVNGYKTNLHSDGDPEYPAVLTFNATRDGKIEVTGVNKYLLMSDEAEFENYEAYSVNNNTAELHIGIINVMEEFGLKFRKIDKDTGKVLQGVTFELKDSEGNSYGEATTDDYGYMIFTGLTKKEDTVSLYETSAGEGYDAEEYRENPIEITYKYNPVDEKLEIISIKHNNEDMEGVTLGTIDADKDEDGIIFNFSADGEGIFDIPNKAMPYDVKLFTKVDENGKGIEGIKFDVTLTDENGEEVAFENKDDVKSDENGEVILKNVEKYGNITVELKEDADSAKEKGYEANPDTLTFTYTIEPGQTEVTWGKVLIVESEDETTEYTLPDGAEGATLHFVSEDGTTYDPVAVKDNEMSLKNTKLPYNIVIKKANSFGEPMQGVKFRAFVFKNLTKQQTDLFSGETDENGEFTISGINIYSTPEEIEHNRERLTLVIYEEVPEGHKWYDLNDAHEIMYTIDYRKFEANGDIKQYDNLNGAIISARIKDEDGNNYEHYLEMNSGIYISTRTTSENTHTVGYGEDASGENHYIENTPVYDLDIYKEFNDGNVLDLLSSLKFSAKVLDSEGNLIQDNVKVELKAEDGKLVIRAKDIDTTSVMKETKQATGLQLVLTEAKTNGIKEIKPITVVYDCKYENNQFTTTKTHVKYDGNTYEVEGILGQVFADFKVDENGEVYVINTSKKAHLAIRKVDSEGNTVPYVAFVGNIKAEDGTTVEFTAVTDAEGLATINVDATKVSGNFDVEITEERWATANEAGISEEALAQAKSVYGKELEFIENVTISGLKLIEDDGEVSVDYANASSNNAQVTINKNIMEIVFENNILTYSLPIIKTNEPLTENANANRLANINFNIAIRNENEDDGEAERLGTYKTDENGAFNIENITKTGNDLVLILEEQGGELENYNVLEGKAYIHYSATVDEDMGIIAISFKEEAVTYSNEEEDAGKVEIANLPEIGANALVINVINPDTYSLTLHKVMNVNGNIQEIDENDQVKFKGIISTEANLEFEYEDFINNFDEVKTHADKDFDGLTANGKYTIEDLNYNQAYLYVVEYDVPDSMEAITDVIKIPFSKDKDFIRENLPSCASLESGEGIDIVLDIINIPIAYKIDLIKTDKLTGEKVPSMKNAKFEITLKELEGNKVISTDKVTVAFDAVGNLIKPEAGKYISNVEFDNGVIQLDVNKYGDMMLEIEEKNAPDHYEGFEGTIAVRYTATPQSEKIIVNETVVDEKAKEYGVDAKAEKVPDKEQELSLNITIPNNPVPYDLPIKKSVDNGDPNDIKFQAYILNSNMETVRGPELQTVQNGTFTIKNIDLYGEYYLVLNEDWVKQGIVKLEGFHLFKITASTEDELNEGTQIVKNDNAIKKIEYLGTSKTFANNIAAYDINAEQNGEKIADYFDCEENGIARLEIINDSITPYSIDINKFHKVKKDDGSTAEEPVEETTKFNLYLTGANEDYSTAKNLISNEPYNTSDGIISITGLTYTGEYKLTIIETLEAYGMKKTFSIAEVIYNTSDGKNINVTSVKIDGEEKLTDGNAKVTATSGSASINVKVENEDKVDVPVYIHKVYYELNGAKHDVPNATFRGSITEESTGYVRTFEATSGNDGLAYLGNFKMEDRLTIVVDETAHPGMVDKIPTTTIYVNVKDGKIAEIEGRATNAVEGLEGDNTIVLIDPLPPIQPTITLSGMVWKDVMQTVKGEDTLTDGEGYFTEGIFDKDYDEAMEGVEVYLYDSNNNFIADTTTNSSGHYEFTDLNPFEKYRVEFLYDGDSYESSHYLVQDSSGAEYTGKLKDVINNAAWANNSKAVTNESNLSRATTTATKNAGDIQYYPVYDRYTIDIEGTTLYIKDGKYYISEPEGASVAEFKPLQPTHTYINLGLKDRPAFDFRLTKKVDYIKVTLDESASSSEMTYDYSQYGENREATNQMYKLSISKADAAHIKNMEIVYKITVNNEEVASGYLENIAEYYDSSLLTPVSYRIEGADGTYTITGSGQAEKDIIPTQLYKGGTFIQQGSESTNIATLNIPEAYRELKSGEKITIYVTYNYTDEFINDFTDDVQVGDQALTLGVAEISGSKQLRNERYAGESTADRILNRSDKDSVAGNLMRKFVSYEQFYSKAGGYYTSLSNEARKHPYMEILEDDEDSAPAVKVIVEKTQRTISGNVFEDIDKNGVLANTDTMIKGVTVNLYRDGEAGVIATTQTGTDGQYEFSGDNITAGKYIVEFVYGDRNTVLPYSVNEDNKVTVGDKTYYRNNNKSYNALEFESTDAAENNGLFWYAESERKSDATDDQTARNNANAMLSNEGNMGIMNNERSELLYSYKADLSKQRCSRLC